MPFQDNESISQRFVSERPSPFAAQSIDDDVAFRGIGVFGYLADLFVLYPTRHPIDVSDKTPLWIEGERGQIEIWVQEHRPSTAKLPNLLVIKFPGAGGRAENSSFHPFDAWKNHQGVIWTVNAPGFGGSPGDASIRNIDWVATSVLAAAKEAHPNSRVVLCGNSLGCVSALYLAAKPSHDIAGILLRNPPPLREAIRARRPWWQTAFLSWAVAASVPQQLSAIDNARRVIAPTLIVTSERDKIVPPQLQQLVIDELGGPVRQLVIDGADHGDPISEDQAGEYRESLAWLLEQIQTSTTAA